MKTEETAALTEVLKNGSEWLVKMVSSITDRRKDTCLSKQDCADIESLISNGFSFQDTLSLLKTRKNKNLFRKIEERMEEGTAVDELFPDYCPKELRNEMEGFSSFLTFEESLKAALHMVSREEEMRKEMMQQLTYPLTMAGLMTGGTVLFSKYVIPSMISLMSGFEMDSSNLYLLQSIIQTAVSCITILIAAFAVFFLAMQKRDAAVIVFHKIAELLPGTYLVQKASEEFAEYYLECCRVHGSTREILEMMKNMKSHPLTACIAEEMDAALMKGDSYIEASSMRYTEPALAQFMKIAVYSSDTVNMLESYLKMSRERRKRRRRNLSAGIQAAAYLLIGLLAVLIYQIMMIPMGMIQNI